MDLGNLPNHIKSVFSFRFFSNFSPGIVARKSTIGIKAPSLMSRISFAKFNIVMFDGFGNFGLWQRRVKDLLVQQGMVKALEGFGSEGCDNYQALFG